MPEENAMVEEMLAAQKAALERNSAAIARLKDYLETTSDKTADSRSIAFLA